ncbi:hypothetical protein N865_13710 [Intrasporangium oryzae NRRL B-24470]|uniref:Uncharacterized protein n=1 Tax=Intrasporangium oryzae NRRL B-24470 TaxID=1386089 RepID=W9GAA0_9MICO|nr:hypothetical protein [Intrasporangium oryzae]EWT00804.1 hypothetical protein N865_13710 [Intrasporangium oryzae NRRL B-24470]
MSTAVHGSGLREARPALTPQEAIARDVILERTATRHHAPRRVHRHVHAALVLRRLAERLDPGPSERLAPPPRFIAASPPGRS